MTVGTTRFFLDFKNTKMQNTNITKRYIKSESDSTPAGKIIILPRSAAKVE